MHYTILIACAFALAQSPARADTATLVFNPEDSGSTKVIRLIEWVASLDDLAKASDILPRALGGSQTPQVYYAEVNGKQIKDWTDFLLDAPIWPGSRSKMDYTVLEPDGPAGDWRADIRFYLEESEACVRKADMVSRFGPPTDSRIIPDAATISYGWQLRQTPWKTMVWGEYGEDDSGCDAYLTVVEYPTGS
jgi:hypothetical protein